MARFDDWVTDRDVTLAARGALRRRPARVGQPFLDRYAVFSSSGTTGVPGLIVQDPDALAVYDALGAARLGALAPAWDWNAARWPATATRSSPPPGPLRGRGGMGAAARPAPVVRGNGPCSRSPSRSSEICAQLDALRPTVVGDATRRCCARSPSERRPGASRSPRVLWYGGEWLRPDGRAATSSAPSAPRRRRLRRLRVPQHRLRVREGRAARERRLGDPRARGRELPARAARTRRRPRCCSPTSPTACSPSSATSWATASRACSALRLRAPVPGDPRRRPARRDPAPARRGRGTRFAVMPMALVHGDRGGRAACTASRWCRRGRARFACAWKPVRAHATRAARVQDRLVRFSPARGSRGSRSASESGRDRRAPRERQVPPGVAREAAPHRLAAGSYLVQTARTRFSSDS